MQLAISADPEAHPIVPGTGGVRKARWTRQSKGKSGAVRVILLLLANDRRNREAGIGSGYLLSIYAKSDRSDMTAADRKAAKRFVAGLKDAKKQAGK
jgi:hypothetical protein